MKSKIKSLLNEYTTNQLAFTLVELLVVLSILALVLALGLVNFAALRGPRDLKIAQSQLVTNARKVQSFALSARNISTTGTAAKYYMIQFDTTKLNSYEVQAIDTNLLFAPGIETDTFPSSISYAAANGLQLFNSSGSAIPSVTCVQVAFSLPFGRVYMDETCNLENNVNNPAYLSGIANRKLIVTIRDSVSGQTKTVTLYGISGRIEGN